MKRMVRQQFIPARHSRHRVAALALYRALFKAGRKVPLPKDLQHPGPTHPVAHIARKRFLKERGLTSSRLIYNCMAAGYKFLTLLTKSQTVDSPEHSQIIQHLRKRSEKSALSRSKAPPPRKEKRYSPPIFAKVSSPGQAPRYESTFRPLPKSAISGERKVPVLGSTAEGQVFLRFKKPQPRLLNHLVFKRTKRWRTGMLKLLKVQNYGFKVAKQEDNWDKLVDKLMLEEGVQSTVIPDTKTSTYYWSQRLAKAWYEDKLDRTWEDWVARGKAMDQLIEAERALADEERKIPKEPIDEAEAAAIRTETLDNILGTARQRHEEREEAQRNRPFEDPFMAPRWLELVANLEKTQPKEPMEHPIKNWREAYAKEGKPAPRVTPASAIDEFERIKASRREI
ncbi:hypothetical protein FALBO_8977 [Fusarium albosuccineum]|uniref:Complex 1 LYR protein domain-containing protein n=1 Tax=Fusarium albosuccineum TaxID=1237068 RepID=A0A8H4L7B3_9HYPO|nr:hypothetical protein FALBO_8977 [Fusarium albosuccineum]